ncbi:hybrid-cluster NAD(P)-dependent oxidoreductase [Rhizobium sp. NFACC06-2]|uniref:hybrid-cluster NAD(P)-dependent oxidoreductase n=1 Tax=Rhizobium sp. NFACC06-2 TaxID=1566264 RepID=UPI000876320D|nr:hybrid-cluster NAD(P)-dependent oxidoreductase [Rhizobium sp. NFACC06-2]SCY90454.1 Ferredoxin-NADP reductase [Rhizobium sp. NFACC06-2]
MNAVGKIEASNINYEVAKIVFSMFVYVSDVEKNITALEVRKFQVLIRDTSWIQNEDLRNALIELLDKYSSFWGDYEDEVFKVDGGTLSEAIDRAETVLGVERGGNLRLALGKFMERLENSAFGFKVAQGEQKFREQARRDLKLILGKAYRPAPLQMLDQRPGAPITPPPSVASPSLSASRWPALALSPGQTSVWTGGKINVRCVSVTWETADTKTYSFVSDPPSLFHYKPGQFISIEISLPNGILRRSYTISSSPSRPYTLSITVKKVPMGWMSNWLFNNMVEGFECAISGPSGKFTCFDYPSRKLLFISAGSGITPNMSMLRWLVDTASDADIVFINNVRTPDDIIFSQELLHISTRLSEKLKLVVVPAAASPSRPWHGLVGKLDETLVKTCVPDFKERETFVCGPPGYMAVAKSLLVELGLPPEKYHDESFGVVPVAPHVPAARKPSPTASPVAPSAAKAGSVGKSTETGPGDLARQAANSAQLPPRSNAGLNAAFTTKAPPSSQPLAIPRATPRTLVAPTTSSTGEISIEGASGKFSIAPGQTILEAADVAGVNLTHSCRAGVCGACKMRKISGAVQMDNQTVLSKSDVDDGYILTCVGKATGNVVLAP